MANLSVYTIGHSTRPAEAFIHLLTSAGVEELVDVRSIPASRHAPYTRPTPLQKLLAHAGIGYLYLGDALGGKPAGPALRDPATGKPDFELMSRQKSFQDGIEKLMSEIKNRRVCIMCAEENPVSCHRRLLVGTSLRQKGVRVFHIRGTGQIEPDEEPGRAKGAKERQLTLPE